MDRLLPDDFDDLDDEEKLEILMERHEEVDDALKQRMLEELMEQYS